MIVYLQKSSRPDKKYMVWVNGRRIHFGAAGYSDYTIHKDPARMKRYVKRHRGRENWTKRGIETAGFWSRWLLWNKPTLRDSIQHTQHKFNIIIRRR